MSDLARVLDDAARVAKSAGGEGPLFTKARYEDAMIELASAEARPGESPASALARLCHEGDQRASDLYRAAYEAESAWLVSKRQRAQREGSELAKREAAPGATVEQGSRAHVLGLMERYARLEKREGETFEQAFDRLLQEDEAMRGAYAHYCEHQDGGS